MARLLGPSEYGDMSAILSFVMIASVGGGAISTVTIRYSGELYALRQFSTLKKLWKGLSKTILMISIVLFVLSLILTIPLSHFFSINSKLALIIGFSSIIGGFLILINRGVIQAMQKFTFFSFLSILEMFLKFVFGILLVNIGFKLYGAMAAITLGTLATYFVSFFPLKPIFTNRNAKRGKELTIDKQSILRYSLPTLMVYIILVIGINLDIILVKFYFSPEQAGLYAAISTVAKIVLYATGPIVAVMFPIISESKAKGEKHYNVLLFSIIFTLILALGAMVLFNLIPGKIIGLLYGSQYLTYYWLLPQVGLMILFYTLINLFSNYYLAISEFKFIISMVIFIVGFVVMTIFYHPSIEIIVRWLTLTYGIIFALMSFNYLFMKKIQLINLWKNHAKS